MPHLILFNGKLHTPDAAPASAIALRGRRILALGGDDDILALARPHTRRLDLRGRLVLPGLSDAHFHFQDWALARRELRLAGTPSLEAMLARLAERVRATPPGGWITGQGWNESEWSPPVMPTRRHLDAVSPAHPVILWRADLHAAVANSRALEAAGIGPHTPDPPDGVIDRDAAGQPTGILKERAIDRIRRVLPSPTPEERHQAIREAIAVLHRLGVTALHDQRLMSGMGAAESLRAFQHLHRRGELKLRVCTNIHHTQLSEAIALGLQSGFGDDVLRLGFVKMFSDGSMGAHTAWMLAPYEDGGLGMAAMPVAEMAEVARRAVEHGWAVSVHAIGDRANREVLDIFEELAGIPPQTPLPHRIEHAQLLHPADIPRFARLGLTVSAQPIHLLDDMVLADRVWGERGQYAYAFRSLLATGARLAFGSDCPVADPNPWLGIHAAVNRRKPSGYPDEGWYPAQRLTVAEAVWAYTMGNAIAIGQQAQQGSLAPGKLADLIVTDRDIFAVEPMALSGTKVLMTIFDGEIVYAAETF